MADSMDLAQRRAEEELARNLQRVTVRAVHPSASFCEECGDPIPEARRRAVPGGKCCITCQEILELKSKHYNGGAV